MERKCRRYVDGLSRPTCDVTRSVSIRLARTNQALAACSSLTLWSSPSDPYAAPSKSNAAPRPTAVTFMRAFSGMLPVKVDWMMVRSVAKSSAASVTPGSTEPRSRIALSSGDELELVALQFLQSLNLVPEHGPFCSRN